ncbi:RNase H domain-containing protein [Caerostris extrusa]|uniref:RNase H domain-containing protein n=1 Tax=Caerostris extrusa TaxID=172846 RepID=A0AAV4R9M2_CAEEX|nr:RNase H domain-containing protein [Caerostris extrusa]
MSGRGWGIHPKLIKIWYKTVAERKVCYAATIWAKNMTNQLKGKLSIIQRYYALQISKAYRTSPTSALLTIIGLEPLHLVAQRESCYGNVIRLHKDSKFNNKLYRASDFEQIVSQWKEAPWKKIINKQVDGKQTKSTYTLMVLNRKKGVGSAFVAYQGNKETHGWKETLRNSNSIYQAELNAISPAILWASTSSYTNIEIHTDSETSVKSIYKFFNNNPLIYKIRKNIQPENQRKKLCNIMGQSTYRE